MPYTPSRSDWKDWPDTSTKVESTHIEEWQNAISDAADTADTAVSDAADAQTTADAAIPKSTVTTAGDLLYATGSAALSRLAAGSTQDQLSLNGSAPVWVGNPIYNVMHPVYGATGDGTTDDTTAIQDAIDDAVVSGGVVLLPPGAYKITSSLDFSALKNTNKIVTLKGAGHGNFLGTTDGATYIKNSQAGPAITAYGTLSGATNQEIVGLNLEDFIVENQEDIGTDYTIDLDYVIAGWSLKRIFVLGGNLGGNGIQVRNFSHGQGVMEAVTVRSFDDGIGFRIATEVTSNVDTAPNSGNCTFNACSSIDTFIGWNFDGTNLLNGLSLVSCKAVRSGTTVGAVTGSIGYKIETQCKASSFAACHAENYETGFSLEACEFNTFNACSAYHPSALVDSNTAGFRLSGTSPTGNEIRAAHVQALHYGVRFEDNARTNYASGWDRSGSRVVTSFFSDVSTPLTNIMVSEETTAQLDFGKYLIFATFYRVGTGSTAPTLRSGSGTPEGSVTARIGSLYLRTDGGASTTLYVKESGTGNTGWVAK